MTGRIIKGIAGFYYVHDGENVYECKAKGIFRKNHQKPLVGDNVLFDVVSASLRTGTVTEILEEKNSLIRPEAANIDAIYLVFSASIPEPNYTMLNRYLVSVHDTGIPVKLVVNKTDLTDGTALSEISRQFENTCYPVFFVSVREEKGLEALRDDMKGHVNVFAGPSGVGKSSLLNSLIGEGKMEIGELSRKIARGKNTTRHTELFVIGEDTYLLDTPGFTSVEIPPIEIENLPFYFDEFLPYVTKCRFTNCSHYKETDCAVKEAVRNGIIPRSRYVAYRDVYEYLKDLRKY